MKVDIQKGFGERLKQLRKQEDFSQEELAAKAGLHRTYISDIERGARNVSLQNIEKLANALGLKIKDIF